MTVGSGGKMKGKVGHALSFEPYAKSAPKRRTVSLAQHEPVHPERESGSAGLQV